MVLDLILKKTDDGVTAEIPSINGCESWAHDEETALDNIMNLAAYYLKTDVKSFKVDKARTNKLTTVYKIIFIK